MFSKEAVIPLGGASFEKLDPGGQPDPTPTMGPEPLPIKKKEKSKKEVLFSNRRKYRKSEL